MIATNSSSFERRAFAWVFSVWVAACGPRGQSGFPGGARDAAMPDGSAQVVPATEQCGDQIDNDLDGTFDEDCACTTTGETRPCWVGRSWHRGVGACHDGQQTCEQMGGGEFIERTWTLCTGVQLPSTEIHGNRIDEDCNGNHEGCYPQEFTLCEGGTDDDCDGLIDCADPDCAPTLDCGGTCEGVVENAARCNDGRDNDCDGNSDCMDSECRNLVVCGGTCEGVAETGARCADGRDNDCDGQIDCADSECAAEPGCSMCEGVTENAARCTDGRDNDCDGNIDCADAECATHPSCSGPTCPTGVVYPVTASRLPGTLLVVFDQSTSMGSTVGTSDDSRWSLATQQVRDVLRAAPDNLTAGLLLFPSGLHGCSVVSAPQVAPAPLSTTRAQITVALSGQDAGGGNTPLATALEYGWSALRTTPSNAGKGLLLVTDGEETCSGSDSAARDLRLQNSAARASEMLRIHGIRTFVVGLQVRNGFLSQLAANGGTQQSADCNPTCAEFQPDACGAHDCDSGRICNEAEGYCGCNTDTDCGTGLHCSARACVPNGSQVCCNYSVGSASFQVDFRVALEAATSALSGDCVFEVPSSDTFDPNRLNVGVTFPGEARLPVRHNPQDGWEYVTAEHARIEIHGGVCDRLRSGNGAVEIVLGCATR